ncbi:hypothetical protein F5B20DRAFT_580941 [Whalleya microplaca]|nr:hypothetical protein F5B20DRAFT_580941 [Whalleya microplaca]
MHALYAITLLLGIAKAAETAEDVSIFAKHDLKTSEDGHFSFESSGALLSKDEAGNVLDRAQLNADDFKAVTGCALGLGAPDLAQCLEDARARALAAVSPRRDAGARIFRRLSCAAIFCTRSKQCRDSTLARCDWCAIPPGMRLGACVG